MAFTENTNVCNWLLAGRSQKLKGLRYLATWEQLKLRNMYNVTSRWLPGGHNVSADKLAKDETPGWL